MRHMPSRIIALLAIAGACTAEEAPVRSASGTSEIVQRDSAGVRIVEVPGALLDDLPEWKLSDQPVLAIGGVEAEGPFALDRVAGAIRLQNTDILVADGSQDIRVFGSDGSFIRQVGGRGQGPGEFSGISFVAHHDNGVLIMDGGIGRATILTADGTVLDTYRPALDSCVVRISHGVGHTCPPAGALSDGTIVTAQILQGPRLGSERAIVTPRLFSFIGLATKDAFLDLDSLPRATEVWVRVHDIPSRGSRVFDPEGAYAVGRDLIALGTGDRFDIQLRDLTGALVKVLRVDRSRRAVTQQDLEIYREEDVRRAMLEAGGAADSVPHFSALRLDDVDRLWVREYSGNPSTTPTWIVFDPSGNPLARLRLPYGVFQIGSDFVLALETVEFGVQRVVLYTMEAT